MDNIVLPIKKLKKVKKINKKNNKVKKNCGHPLNQKQKFLLGWPDGELSIYLPYVRHVRVDLYLTMNFAANRFNISDYEDRYTI